MARAIWKGSIAFGLVNIPVELHPGVRESRPRFRMLHARDKSPVKFERVCAREGKPVAWDELVKGYEYEKGRFVVLTKEDFRLAALEKSRTVDIRNFVNGEDIDDRFFESSYFLTPGKGGERAYALLREAIRETGLVGIATIVLPDAQHLAALEIVKAKLKGKSPDLEVEEEPRSAEVVDLMERLRQSLQQTGGAKKQAKSGAKKSTSRGKKRKAA